MSTWSSSYITSLPDSAFACVQGKDRFYPHHDSSGALDLPHLRAALSRIGDPSNEQCGKAHLEAHAKAENMGQKAEASLKATLIDDDAFRLLALPFGGPIPYPGAPRGADLDRQWFSEATDFDLSPKTKVPVTWHHGFDPVMGKAVLGHAVDPELDDEGGWVTVWLEHGNRRVNLISKLADMGGRIFGSSEAEPSTSRIRAGKAERPWRRDLPGEITRWWYRAQTLSTSPQNTNSILVPLKATLSDLASDDLAPTASFFDDLASFLDTLAPSSETGKAGRVLAARNEARLREARDMLDESYYDARRRKQAIDALDAVLRELESYINPDT